MATTRGLETRLTSAAVDLDYIRGDGTDKRTSSPFAQARTNLTTWAGKGAGRSGLTGTRNGTSQDLADRVADAVDAGHSLTHDEHTHALAELDKQAIRVEHELQRLRKLVDAATMTKPTANLVTRDRECATCASVGRSRVIYSRGLCRWGYDWAERITPGGYTADVLIHPHSDITAKHCAGKRIPAADWQTYHGLDVTKPTATDDDERTCGHPTFIDGQPGTCALTFMHDGQCDPTRRV